MHGPSSLLAHYYSCHLRPTKTNMVNHTVVLYPAPSIGNFVSMVELGKLITKHHPSFSVTVLVTTPPHPHNSGSTISSYINQVSKTIPYITFHYLPTISLSATTSSIFDLLHLNEPLVHQALKSISTTTTNISAFIVTTFSPSIIQIIQQLDIPLFLLLHFRTSALSILLHMPTVHKSTSKSFKDLNTLVNFPGLPPIPSSDMIKPLLDRTEKIYDIFLNIASQIPKSQGIIVNTFEPLESRVLKSVSDGLCVPDAPTPPTYCVGPLIASGDRSGGDVIANMPCLDWLDLQPKRSVVFLCFGSMGSFSEAQLKEIAIGLEQSRQRFLWVVRSPPREDDRQAPDLDMLLPQGFLDRTKERGLVLNSWAPQVQVLSRESVGGFVTHCGWNSVLEAVCAGVPMVAWPLYAEQRVNRVILVEEMKLAMPMEEVEGGFVHAQEVEKRVRGLMESKEGKFIRDRVAEMSAVA